MRFGIVFSVLLAACGFESGGPRDSGAAVELCYGSFPIVCFDGAANVPTSKRTIPDSAVDTDNSPLCDAANDHKAGYCVIAGAGIEVPSGVVVRAYGTRPLILLSIGDITIAGAVDVSSKHLVAADGSHRGAGANPAAPPCNGGTPPKVDSNGGGFGGSFGGAGADGQNRDNPPSGGVHAEPLTAPPTLLRGGCPGSAGATQAVGQTPGLGGGGGGAVAILATGAIKLRGTINASGAGGQGGPAVRSGGGGGGSGGMIYLAGASISIDAAARVYANGGGGGEGGAGSNGGGTAAIGADGGDSTAVDQAGLGGNGHEGGDGGNGAVGTTLEGQGGAGSPTKDGGGGGGGGGAGFIHALGLTVANASPTPT